ncbi:hypothetical protein KSS87_015962 [Heliosperma pusillum]|nr:hypothetical protein KSS87_015962 [Heliosperma pusillum]
MLKRLYAELGGTCLVLAMMLHTQSTCETYYDILNVKEDASFEDIRQSYRSAILQYHPDKLCKPSQLPYSGKYVEDRFLKVKKAMEILGDSRSRALYDHNIRSLQSDILVGDEIALEDMTVDDTEEDLELCHKCQCGDFFVISCSELEEMGYELVKHHGEICVRNPQALPSCIILPCGSCSLRIRILVNMDGSTSDDQKNV